MPVWHLFVVRTNQRDELQRSLATRGIGTLIHYPRPPFLQEAYAEFAARADEWPLAAEIARTVVSLPIGPHLAEEGARAVIAALREAEGVR